MFILVCIYFFTDYGTPGEYIYVCMLVCPTICGGS